MKKLLYILVIIIASVSIASCSNNSMPADDKTLVVCMGNDPIHFNPNIAESIAGYPASNIMSHLIGRDDMNNYVVDLAESWSISDEGKKYTFNLTKNVRWHDGEPFTAADVEWTFKTIIKEKGLLVNRLSSIDSIACPDDLTVVFKLKEPDASFLSVVANAFILPRHIYEGTDWRTNAANLRPIGTGPFKFVEYKRDSSIILEANDDYFRGRPNIDKLIYRIIPDENTAVQAFKNGEVDILDYSSAVTPSAVPELEGMNGVRVVKSISTSRQYIAFNLMKEPFDSIDMRQAVAFAVDRDEIVAKAHKGYGSKAEGFYTPAVTWAYNDRDVLPKRDLDNAIRALNRAGYYPDQDGVRLKDIDIVTFQFPTFVDMARVVQENLKEIGIEANITVLEYSAWYEQVRRGDFHIAIVGGDWGSDPEGLTVRVNTHGFMNIMGYSNPEIDYLLEKGRKTFIQDERAAIYKDVQKIISEDLPIVPLSEWMYIVATRDYINGHPIDDGLGKIPSGQYSLIRIDNQ